MTEASAEERRTARRRVRDRLGSRLADRATDDFCLAVERFTDRPMAAAEVGVAPTQPVNAVIEFREAPGRGRPSRRTDRLASTQEWQAAKRAIAQAKRYAPNLPLESRALLRHAGVTAARSDFYRVAGPIYAEVERSAGGLMRAVPETFGSPPASPALTQVCWLNRSIRAWADPRVLAEVVADDNVALLDVPRRLEADVVVGAATIGANAYRAVTGSTGEGIVVAVLDTEVQAQHPALRGRVILKRNRTWEPWGFPSMHGTAVAGIIGANGGGITGIAPGVTIYNYKVLATIPWLNADDFDGAVALQLALEDGAHIANCSWGDGPAGDGTSRLARACDEAWALGMVIVKSAGNRGPRAGSLTSPADADGVIVVGATDRAGQTVPDYSSRGPTAGGAARPHLVAPGGTPSDQIVSCTVAGGVGHVTYGTSYAAPHVAGMAALVLEQDPDVSPDEIRALFLDACALLPGVDENTQGAGVVSLSRLVRRPPAEVAETAASQVQVAESDSMAVVVSSSAT